MREYIYPRGYSVRLKNLEIRYPLRVYSIHLLKFNFSPVCSFNLSLGAEKCDIVFKTKSPEVLVEISTFLPVDDSTRLFWFLSIIFNGLH